MRLALGYHRFGAEGFRHLTGEFAIGGRYDLLAIGPSLRGLFVEGELGLGMQGYGFDATGRGVRESTNGLLLFRSAFGIYLADRGELSVFYDHRRDGFAGALSINSVAAGTPGHVGIRGQGFFGGGDWGMRAQGKYGSAWILELDLMRRWQ